MADKLWKLESKTEKRKAETLTQLFYKVQQSAWSFLFRQTLRNDRGMLADDTPYTAFERNRVAVKRIAEGVEAADEGDNMTKRFSYLAVDRSAPVFALARAPFAELSEVEGGEHMAAEIKALAERLDKEVSTV